MGSVRSPPRSLFLLDRRIDSTELPASSSLLLTYVPGTFDSADGVMEVIPKVLTVPFGVARAE